MARCTKTVISPYSGCTIQCEKQGTLSLMGHVGTHLYYGYTFEEIKRHARQNVSMIKSMYKDELDG